MTRGVTPVCDLQAKANNRHPGSEQEKMKLIKTWLTDDRVRSLSPTARGVFIDMICLMETTGGVLSDLNHFAEISKMVQTDLQEFLDQIKRTGLIQQTIDGGYECPDLVHELRIKEIRKSSGSRGGNPILKVNLVKQNDLVNQNLVNQKSEAGNLVNQNGPENVILLNQKRQNQNLVNQKHCEAGNLVNQNGVVENLVNQNFKVSSPSSSPPITPSSTPSSSKEENPPNPPTVDLPVELDTPEFRKAWQNWIGYRRTIKKTLKPVSQAVLLKKLAKWGVEESIASIEISISNGWQGLFEPKENGTIRGSPGARRDKGTYKHTEAMYEDAAW